MNREELKIWLDTLDPEHDWDLDNIDNLEEQIVDNVKECGYINIKMLLSKCYV